MNLGTSTVLVGRVTYRSPKITASRRATSAKIRVANPVSEFRNASVLVTVTCMVCVTKTGGAGTVSTWTCV